MNLDQFLSVAMSDLTQEDPVQPQANTFHPFPRLPAEIRYIIFHYAALSLPPRTIEIHFIAEDGLTTPLEPYSAKRLDEIARNRNTYHSSRVRTATLFPVNSQARDLCLALYQPCKTTTYDIEMPWMPELAPYMEEPRPPFGGSVFDPRKDTLIQSTSLYHASCGLIVETQSLPDLVQPYPAARTTRSCLDALSRDPKAVAHIESLAIVRGSWAIRQFPIDLRDIIQILKRYKRLRELIMAIGEEWVSCDDSRRLGLEIRRRELILLDVKDLINQNWRSTVNKTIVAAQQWKRAFSHAQAGDRDGWKAPEIKVKIARRGK